MPDQQRLPWAVRVGYGLGDFALVLTYQLAGLFLLFFMTDVLGIPPATAGLMMLIGLVFDGITDVGMGVLADRTRARLGGYRLWLLLGGPFLAAGTALMFASPPVSGPLLLAAALGAQLFFRAAFTVVAIPYGALSSALTQDSRERSLLTGFRLMGSTLASLTVAVAVQPLVAAFGAGDDAKGFFHAASLIGVTAAGVLVVTFLAAREKPAQAALTVSAYRLRALPRFVLRNGPFLQVAACMLCHASAQAFVLAGAPYYFSFVRGEPESLGLSMAVMIGGVAVFVPVWTVISRQIGKRLTWIIGASWSAVALLVLSTMAQALQPLFLAGMAAAAFGFAAVNLTAFAMLPDTVEFGEWQSGVRVEAALFAALTLSQKVATGIAAAGSGLMLELVGHSKLSPMAGAGAQAFGVMIFVAPALAIALSLLAIWRYPLSTALHARLVRALAWRRARRQR